MKHKVKIDGNVFGLVANELRRNIKGFRGLSSKKKRKHEKNVKKVIPIILEIYMTGEKNKILEEFVSKNEV